MYSNTSLSSVCRQHIHSFKAITYTLLLIVSLLVVSACSQPGQVGAATPTSTPATIPPVVGSPSSPTPAPPCNSVHTIHMTDLTTALPLTNPTPLCTTIRW